MKRLLIFLALIITVALVADPLDDRYHTYEEITELLNQYEIDFPGIAKVYTIGYSTGAEYYEPEPILALKISNNVEVDEDEPAVLYLGQMHAEEVLGVEITMYMIDEVLNSPQFPFNVYRANLEMWFVPTWNPFGLGVIHDGTDTSNSWRKNGRDNNENGVFDFANIVGGDVDGVDNNRNFSFNWIHGDPYLDDGSAELYDYYRGPWPMSEGENQAIKNLAEMQHFIYSIQWHSSRTGNLSEKVFYSYNWDGVKQSPDYGVNTEAATNVAGLIPTQDGVDHYEPSGGQGRKGSEHDWFYQNYATTQLLIECGTADLQPTPDIVDDTCERASEGAYWLMDRLLGTNGVDKSMLTGHVTDAVTGDPIVAEVILHDHVATYFEPRLTDEPFGRYWRQVESGTYTLTFQKEGYESQTIENIVANNSMWATTDVALQPKAAATLSGNISTGSEDVTIIIHDLENDTLSFNGNYNIDSYEGPIKMWVMAEGFVPQEIEMNLTAGANTLDLDMDSAEVIFEESWDAGLDNWITEGNWAVVDNNGNNVIDDSPDAFYEVGQSYYLMHDTSINLSGVANDVMLQFEQKVYLEDDYDFAKVQVSLNGNNWETIAQYTGKRDKWSFEYSEEGATEEWNRELVSLAGYMNNSIFLRFILESDDTIDDPGWKIDNIQIVSSTPADNAGSEIPSVISGLYSNYPNPFNPSTSIKFGLKNDSHVNITIYNVRGQKVKTLIDNEFESGVHQEVWNGTDDKGSSVSSGIYFYKFIADSETETKRMILMK